MSDIKIGGPAVNLADLSMGRLQNQLNKAENLSKTLHSKNTASVDEASKAATQFEAMLVGQMVKSMWATVPQGGLISGSREEEMYRDMFTDALAENIADGPGLGIKQVVLDDILRLQKTTK